LSDTFICRPAIKIESAAAGSATPWAAQVCGVAASQPRSVQQTSVLDGNRMTEFLEIVLQLFLP
jgi:hypothetical protein